MKNKKHTNLVIRSTFALALVLAVWSPVQAQSPAPAGEKMMEGKMMESHQTMMQHHEAMMAEMKAQDADLTAQVATMNSAPADKKLDLMAAIVTSLVKQRAAMTTHMEKMHGEMKPMMEHMQMGRESMSPQPMMMKGMGDQKEDTKKEPK